MKAIEPLRQSHYIQEIAILVQGGGKIAKDAVHFVKQSGAQLVFEEIDENGLGTVNTCDQLSIKELSRARLKAMKTLPMPFQLCAPHPPAGDQANVIQFLTDSIRENSRRFHTLHGVTGSGKTFMMANVIANLNKPALILAPNKTLAAQLCSELANYFPHNRVEFFVSHFKHYQPEAYIPSTDKYISKSSSVDNDIDRLRHAATRSLFERNDTIVIASVSSIYGLGLPTEYLNASLRIRINDQLKNGVEELVQALIDLKYVPDKPGKQISRGSFRRNDSFVDISPPWELEGIIYRISFLRNRIKALCRINSEAGTEDELGEEVVLYPAKHFAIPQDRLEDAMIHIEEETRQRVDYFRMQGKYLEANRLEERVALDIEMMRKVGYCHGAENYTYYLNGRYQASKSAPPETLLDYMPKDGNWLLFIDESHVTIPQLRAMHAANDSRKRRLIEYGFRLPSALENRPLTFGEFWQKTHQTIFVSATPGPYEIKQSADDGIVQAVIRPTGVLDPTVDVVNTVGQMEHLTLALAKVVSRGGKAIITTITKRFAEDLAEFISKKPPVLGVLDRQLRVAFLHSGIDSVGRMQIMEALREESIEKENKIEENEDGLPSLDVVVGINLLREGVDLPAVRLVAILDADSEGFLRGETALIQTIGRAARNIDGHVIMYADRVTPAMRMAIDETSRRRRMQMEHNLKYRIIPSRVGQQNDAMREEGDILLNRIRKLRLEDGKSLAERRLSAASEIIRKGLMDMNIDLDSVSVSKNVDEIKKQMLGAAENEDFETAAALRDVLIKEATKSVQIPRERLQTGVQARKS